MALSDYRLDKLPRSTQFIIFGALALGLCASAYFFYLKGAMEERDSLQVEVNQLETAVAQGTAIAGQLKRFKAELAQLEMRLQVLRSILPAAKETPMVLRGVQEMAVSSNLKIVKFGPQPAVPREFYSDWPIEVKVEGSYNALGQFFEKISRYTRIINVDNINVKAWDGSTDPQRTLTAVCTATTFVFREEEVVPPGN